MSLVAAAWVLLYVVLFFVVPPSGGTVARGAFWPIVPFELLDVVDPPPPEPGDLPAGWGYLSQRLDLFAVAALILAGSRSLGWWLLRTPILPKIDDRAEREFFAWGLGLSAWSLIVLGFGLVGAMSPWLFGATLVFPVAAEVFAHFRRPAKEDTEDGRWPPWWFLAAATVFVFLFALGAVLPPTEYDAKGYHLLGPKDSFESGRIRFLPHNVYTSFPFLTEMLTLSGVVLRGDWFRGALIGRLVLAAFGPLTALGVYVVARRYGGRSAGWMAALISLSTPWAYLLSTTSYVEGALSFYVVAALLASLRAVEAPSRQDESPSAPLLAGLMAGSALACKYPAALTVVVPCGLLVAWRSLVGPENRFLRTAATYALGVAVAAGPWLLKNGIETGNPVYPLASSVFGGRDLTAEQVKRWNRAHSPDDHDLRRLPADLLEVTLRNGRLSALLFAFAPLSLLVLARRPSPKDDRSPNRNHRPSPNSPPAGQVVVILWLYVGYSFLVWWGLTHRIDRFWVPMLPAVTVLAGIGATQFATRGWCRLTAAVVVPVVYFNLALCTSLVTSGASGYSAYLVDLDEARERAERLTAPAVFEANARLDEDDVVLCVGEAQVFDARFHPLYNTVFDESLFVRWFAEADPNRPQVDWPLRSTDRIREELAKAGVTHLLVNWSEIVRYRAPGSYGFPDFVTPARFASLTESGLLSPVASGIPRPLSESERAALSGWGEEFVVEMPAPEGAQPALRHAWELFEVVR